MILAGDPEFLDDLRDRLAFIPTLELISSIDISRYRLAEWDVVVCFDGRTPTAEHIPPVHMIVFGGENIGPVRVDGGSIFVQASATSVAREIIVPTDLEADLGELVRQDLVPRLLGGENKAFMHRTVNVPAVRANSDYVKPFAHDADGLVLAGVVRSEPQGPTTWYLPAQVDVPRWIRAALEHWAKSAPEVYRVTEDWRRASRWMTEVEYDIQSRQKQAEVKFREAERQFEEQSAIRDAELAAASAEADRSVRRLLIAQGDPLVDAVGEALKQLELVVEQMDPKNAAKGHKLEDLRVSDGSEFMALVEVRGYTGGAKTGDLLRLGQFTSRFILESGREPSAIWYVVNQFVQRDPSSREMPLQSRQDDVETFASIGGAIIDTRTLYDVLLDVEAGALSREDAKELLKSARGVFTYSHMRTR